MTDENNDNGNELGKSKPEFTVEPAIREFDNKVDYITEIGPGRVNETHPHRYNRWEVIIKLPDPTDLLETDEAQIYSEEFKVLWGIDLATALREVLGASLGTRPAYHMPDVAFDKDRNILENGHAKMQELADEYVIGATKAKTAKVSKADVAELKKAKEGVEELGFEDMSAMIAKMKMLKDAGMLED